jgi:hypothetical protein
MEGWEARMPVDKPPGSFAAIVVENCEGCAPQEMLDAFGFEGRETIEQIAGACIEEGIVHPGYGGLMRVWPAPPGEPEIKCMAWPDGLRLGIVGRILDDGTGRELKSVAVFFSEGVQHRFHLREIRLSPLRDQALLVGDIGEMEIVVYEPLFAAERAHHGEGSVHDILLYGVAYDIAFGPPPPIEVAMPFDPATGERQEPRTETLRFDDAAIMMPNRDMPGYYTIAGPVKHVAQARDRLLGEFWRIRLTAARLEAGDCDIDIVLPWTIIPDRPQPVPGEMVQVSVRLCCRLWAANCG